MKLLRRAARGVRDFWYQFNAPARHLSLGFLTLGGFLAEVSPRRYFCVQCHVTQTDAQPLVANGFRDIDEVLRSERAQ